MAQIKRYLSHIEFFKGERRCANPEYRVDCIEFITEWIPRQHEIIGCQMNLWEAKVLRLLSGVKELALVVNYQEWMSAANRGNYENAFKGMSKFYPLMKNTCTAGGDDKCGVKVYKNITSNSSWSQQHSMHEKFLLGRTWNPEKDAVETSVIYGSFNLSQTASKGNWESILVFRNNDDLWSDLCMNFMLAWYDSNSIPWEDLSRDQNSDVRTS
jgi:hypothetical protein